MKRRPCSSCQRNRAERFFTSERGRVCVDCQKRKRRETARRRHVSTTYGLSADEHAIIEGFQGGVCAICNGVRRYALHVDHCHATNLVRGLVCARCNKLLRDVRDDVDLLLAAVQYLEAPPAQLLGIEAVAR